MKRAFDLILILLGAPLWVPLLGLTALLARSKLGSPVLFRQARPGLGGKPFKLLKLRTMTEARGDQGLFLPDEQRLTPFGSWLRTTSLDELPELFNVLRGEMSLVGPRPLLMQYLSRYTTEQARRHEVRPGITGWAQVNGRNSINWDDKFRLDVWYVDHQSLWLDIKILWMTARNVLARKDIDKPGYVGTQEFMGSVRADLGTDHSGESNRPESRARARLPLPSNPSETC
jgi:lipopolysaccharide/colanic/teichoic acid biosynthesis glycosyltransferase